MSNPNFKDRVKHVFSDDGDSSTIDDHLKVNFKGKPLISYDHIFLEDGNKYSFSNDELNKKTSEEYPDESDYSIYFKKIKKLCNHTIKESEDDWKEHVHIRDINNTNNKIKKLVYKIFDNLEKIDEFPYIIQFALYTNKNSKKSPRIFGLISYAIVYILFYDPYHEMFSSKLDED